MFFKRRDKMKSPYFVNLDPVPALFVSKATESERALFALIGKAVDSGEVFFEFMPTDLWCEFPKQEYGACVLIKKNDTVVLEVETEPSVKSRLEASGLLMVFSNVAHVFDFQTKVESLEDVNQWIEAEEKRLMLDQGSIGAILLGVWKEKPF